MRIHYGHAIPRSRGSPRCWKLQFKWPPSVPSCALISLFSSKHLIFMRHSNSTSLLFEPGPRSRDTTRRCHFAKLFATSCCSAFSPPMHSRVENAVTNKKSPLPMEKLEESKFYSLNFPPPSPPPLLSSFLSLLINYSGKFID